MTRSRRADGITALRSDAVAAVTAAQMAAVDQAATEQLGLALPVMMENAGRHLAHLTQALFEPTHVTVLAGPGGNGGGGLVAARHLTNRGVQVDVLLATDRVHEVTRQQLRIANAMGLPIRLEPQAAAGRGVLVDALLGYSLRGQPAARYADLAGWINTQPGPVVALDTPSGLDVSTGTAAGACVTADATLTLALPKTGLLDAPQVGRLFLADLGIPAVVYDRAGVDTASAVLPADLVELLPPGTDRT